MSHNQVGLPKLPPLPANTICLILVGTLLLATGARAAEWVETPFDPPIGSRWIIQTNETTEDNRDGRVQTSVTTETSELTIDQKIPDGFRVSYVKRDASYKGDDVRRAAISNAMTEELKSVVIHATTAPNGMPLLIENLDEVLSAARGAIDRVTAADPPGKPGAAAVLRQMMTRMLIVDEQQAPKFYLTSLETMALAQNTGLHPGQTRPDANDVSNPFTGAPVKSNTFLRIDSADPATGNVRYVRTGTLDPSAVKEFLSKMAERLGGNKNDSQLFNHLFEQFNMNIDRRMEINVEQGMTRVVRNNVMVVGRAMGRNIVRHTHTLMTITQAP